MRNASARGFEMKAPFNNNLPAQTNDVMVNPLNPVNPDSKPHSTALIIFNEDRTGCRWFGRRWVLKGNIS
jgi:hypothetical protein